jgi:hypothetical protein
MVTKKQMTQRRAQQHAYDRSEAGRARRHRYNTGVAGKTRNDRIRIKRRNDPEYEGYRSWKKLIDRRYHGKTRYDRTMARPWGINETTAMRIFQQLSGFRVDSKLRVGIPN